MLTLYLGGDPEIALTDNENLAHKLARENKKFKRLAQVRDYLDKNDNDVLGYLYYSCWKFHRKVFQS